MTTSKTLRLLLAVTLSALAFSTVGCAGETGDEEDGEEEVASTEEAVSTSTRAAQVVKYARAKLCDVGGNHEVVLECPIATDRAVMSYAKDKLGRKAYRCKGTGYICLNY